MSRATAQRIAENFHRIQAHVALVADIQQARDSGRTPQDGWRCLEDRARRLDAEIIALELADLERATCNL